MDKRVGNQTHPSTLKDLCDNFCPNPLHLLKEQGRKISCKVINDPVQDIFRLCEKHGHKGKWKNVKWKVRPHMWVIV